MKVRALLDGDGEGNPAGWCPVVLTVGLTLWLGGFWYCSDPGTHRSRLWLLVLPGLLLNLRAWGLLMREEGWVRFVVLLLGFQWVSRFWSDPATELVADFGDVLMVGVFLSAVLVMAPSELVPRWVVPSLGMVAALVSLLSLLVFYGDARHSVAEDRLRNILIYTDGLNAVLTGLLCSFGGLLVAWKTARGEGGPWRWVWLVGLVLLVLGILATQSRGAMLAFGVGFGVLLVVERRRLGPALLVCALTTGSYIGLLVWVQAGGEAVRDMLGRGATGRFEIWEWFMKQMGGGDGWIGQGMAQAATVPEDQFGWFIEHPHSIYVTQFFLTGAIGTGLLLVVLALAMQAAWKLAGRGEALWLALLAGFCVALIFDGAQTFSLRSIGRLEPLLVLFPAAIAIGRVRGSMGRGGPGVA